MKLDWLRHLGAWLAWNLRPQPLLPESPAEAEARELLTQATSALALGRSGEAEADARSVMAMYISAGPGGEPYQSAWMILVLALAQSGRHPDAVEELTKFIGMVSTVRGRKSFMVARLQVIRAGQLSYLGRFNEAEADCRAAIKRCRKLSPNGAANRLRFAAVNNLLVVLNGRDLHAEAESAARQAIGEAESAQVSEHALLLSLRRCLAVSLNGLGRYTEAAALLRDMQPEGPLGVVSVRTYLAAAQLGLGDLGEAETGAREAVEEGGRLLGPAHNLTLTGGTLLGTALARQGKLDEARRQLRESAAAWAEHFGDAHPKTTAARTELALLNGDTK